MIQRKIGFYEKYIKRALDIVCALLALAVFCPLYAVIAILVRCRLGSPVIFKQPRPGLIDPETGRERIFSILKFRTMTDERDGNGELLPDEKRLTRFGKMLRATSLDELPEAFSILNGDMSVIGPRPQLVRDMVFMTDEQRLRHTAKPGLSGLAQVKGRNAISWEEKLAWDLKYIEKVSFLSDLKPSNASQSIYSSPSFRVNVEMLAQPSKASDWTKRIVEGSLSDLIARQSSMNSSPMPITVLPSILEGISRLAGTVPE